MNSKSEYLPPASRTRPVLFRAIALLVATAGCLQLETSATTSQATFKRIGWKPKK
jgi:hypothetical protein